MKIGVDLRFTAASHMGTGSYAETTVCDIASALGEGDSIWGFAPSMYGGKLAETVPFVGVPLTREATASVWVERLLWDSAIARTLLDVFFSPAGLAPLVKTCATVITIHDLLFEVEPSCFAPPLLAYLKREIPRSVRSADRIIAVSEHTRQELIRHYNAPSERISVIPQRLRDVFKRPATANASILSKMGLPRPYLLTLSNHAPHKNTRFALEVFARWIADGHKPHCLVIAGAGPSPAPPVDLARAVRERNLEDRIVILGRIDDQDLPALYAGADAFLFPSTYEGWGLPPLEAVASGTPAIVSDRGALPEAMGQAAVVLPLDDVEAWTNALDKCVSGPNDALRDAMDKRREEVCRSRGDQVLQVLQEAAEEWRQASTSVPVRSQCRLDVACRGDWFSPSGFGEAARSMYCALVAAGFGPQAVAAPKDDIQVRSLWPRGCSAETPKADVWIHVLPPHLYDLSLPGRHIGFFVWETDRLDTRGDSLHQTWVDALNRVDEVWMPARFLEAVLKESGVVRPIHWVPCAIDTNFFAPGPKRYPAVELPADFDPTWTVFVYAGTWDPRKRPDVLLRAFCKSFTDRDNVLLVLKSYRYGEAERDREELSALVRESYSGTAHVRLITDVLSAEAMAQLYRSATVFVTASRGEGFCLPAAQAMSCAVPVIAARWSAFEDYPVLSVRHVVSHVPDHVRLPGYTQKMQWAEIDEDDLGKRLFWAHHNRQAVRQAGREARAWVQQHISFDAVGGRIKEILRREGTTLPPGR